MWPFPVDKKHSKKRTDLEFIKLRVKMDWNQNELLLHILLNILHTFIICYIRLNLPFLAIFIFYVSFSPLIYVY